MAIAKTEVKPMKTLRNANPALVHDICESNALKYNIELEVVMLSGS